MKTVVRSLLMVVFLLVVGCPDSPSECPSGTFTNGTAMCQRWTECSTGERVASVGTATTDQICLACEEGSYSEAGAFECRPLSECAPGQYVTSAATRSDDRSCAGCTSGTFSYETNASECVTWTTCTMGTYVASEGDAAADRVCMNCPMGTHTTGDNQTTCLADDVCPAGTAIVDNAGLRSCERCEPGQYCAGGDSAIEECGEAWDHDADPATSCADRTVCASGTYVSENGDANTDRSCTACAGGTFSEVTNSASCRPWTTCASGQFVTSSGTAMADRNCAACPEGDFSQAENAATCLAWTECSAGTFVSVEGTPLNDRSCMPCASGTFAAVANSPSCAEWLNCPAGEYVSVNGDPSNNRECRECDPGTYSSSENQTMCIPEGECPAGTVQTEPATSATPPTCAPCDAGEFCAGGTAVAASCGAEQWDDDGSPASACIARSECGAGAYVVSDGSVTEDRVCAVCAVGYYTTTSNESACAAWADCAAGSYVSDPGSTSSDRTCLPCHETAFSSSVNAPTCVLWSACSPGSYVSALGTALTDRICLGCESGTFNATNNAPSCAPWNDCAAGTYVSGVPSDTVDRACTSCGDGTYSDLANQSMCLPFGTCGAGTELTTAGTLSSAPVCTSCEVGQYCAGGSTSAVSCGTRWDHDSDPATGCAVRTNCMPGMYVSNDGSPTMDRSCAACGASSFSTMTNALDCTPWTLCAAGEVEGTAGSSTMDRVCVPGEWTRQFGTPGQDSAEGVAVDNAGNIFVTGFVSFALPGKAHFGGADIFVRKYDSAGVLLWTRQIGTSANDHGRAIGVDDMGHVFVAATVGGALPGETHFGSADMALIKLDGEGLLLWARQMGTNSADFAKRLVVDSNGDPVLMGQTDGLFPGQSSPWPFSPRPDVVAVKYSTDGDLVWTRQLGQLGGSGEALHDGAAGLSVGPDDDIYMASIVYALPGVGGNVYRLRAADGFVVSTLPLVEFPRAIVVDGAHAIFIAAYDDSAGRPVLLKYDASGALVFTTPLSTSQGVAALGFDNSGRVLITGAVFDGALPGQTSAGGADAFVQRFTAAGVLSWTIQFGSSASDTGNAVAVDGETVLVAGYAAAALPGASAAGGSDAFVRRIVP